MPLSSTDDFVRKHVQAGHLYVKTLELATLLSVSEDTIRAAVNKGSLPAIRVGRVIRIHVHDVVKFCGGETT